jgi:hypothetical protein
MTSISFAVGRANARRVSQGGPYDERLGYVQFAWLYFSW